MQLNQSPRSITYLVTMHNPKVHLISRDHLNSITNLLENTLCKTNKDRTKTVAKEALWTGMRKSSLILENHFIYKLKNLSMKEKLSYKASNWMINKFCIVTHGSQFSGNATELFRWMIKETSARIINKSMIVSKLSILNSWVYIVFVLQTIKIHYNHLTSQSNFNW